jgi:hypothetical protein
MEPSEVTYRDIKVISLNKKKHIEGNNFYIWRALVGYFLWHKITLLSRKKHTGGSNVVST